MSMTRTDRNHAFNVKLKFCGENRYKADKYKYKQKKY